MITQDIKCLGWIKNYLFLNKNKKIIFDVGANTGDFTKLVLESEINKKDDCDIYSIEPHPVAFKKLKENFNNKTNVKPYNFGFGSLVQEKELFGLVTEGKESGGHLSSFLERKVFHEVVEKDKKVHLEKQLIQMTTIDIFCTENNINLIDYLKIDVEGLELEVFKGAEEMLKTKKILAGQFEIGGAYSDAGIDMYDIVKYLNALNYKVYFTEIHPKNEITRSIDFNKITDGWENLIFINNILLEEYNSKQNNFNWEDIW